MCGLIGMISRRYNGFYRSDIDLFQQMLLIDQLRGKDSTGVFSVHSDKEVNIAKVASHPSHLFMTTGWDKLSAKAVSNGRILIGHNRAATRGAVSSTNAHPFHENNIILAHNGTVHGSTKDLGDADVDSHAICQSFAEKGYEETIKNLDAAFAFIWWDMKDMRLRVIRNDERPLYLIITDDVYYLCSEPWMMYGPYIRIAGNTFQKIKETVDLEPGELYEFKLDSTLEKKQIKLKESYYNNYQGYWQGRGGHGNSSPKSQDGPTSTTKNVREVIDQTMREIGDDSLDDALPKPKDSPFREAANALITHCATSNEHFKKGDEILVQFFNSYPERNQSGATRYKLTGTCISPGKPATDCVGYTALGIPIEQVRQLVSGPASATAIGFSSSNCGPSIWVNDIKLAPMVKNHNTDQPEALWNYICKESKCKECGGHIYMVDAPFTHVKRKNNLETEVICADCIEKKLPKGEVRDAFTQRRLDALQDGVQVSQESEASTKKLIVVEGSKTLQ